MIKVIKGLIILVIFSSEGISQVSLRTQTELQELAEAMIYVESRGNDSAYNKHEEAVGCLQIRPIMVREVNRLLKKRGHEERYSLEDRWSRDKSIQMLYVIAREVNREQDNYLEIIARKWNGGYRGHQKDSTERYWQRVERQLVIKK